MDGYRITTHAALRELVSDANRSTRTRSLQRLGALECSFIEESPMLFVATAGLDGRTNVSPKTGVPGFVAVSNARTLLVPERPGGVLADSLANLIDNPRIALLFAIPGSSDTLCVEGRATLTRDPRLLLACAWRAKGMRLVVSVHVERCFFHSGDASGAVLAVDYH